MRLVELDVEHDDIPEAWERGLKALRHNRNDDKLEERVVALWSLLDSSAKRADALSAVDRVFGAESAAWLARLRLPTSSPSPEMFAEFNFFDMPRETPGSLSQLVDLPEQLAGVTEPFASDRFPSDVDPDSPNSALLGDSL